MSEQRSVSPPMRQPTGKPGSPQIVLDEEHLEVIAEQAAERMPERAIAAILGISDDTFMRLKDRDERVLRALQRGRSRASMRAAREWSHRIAVGKISDVGLMFISKQPVEQGGLGMIDERMLNVQGEIKHTVTPAQDAAQRRLQREQAQDADVIEVEDQGGKDEDAR